MLDPSAVVISSVSPSEIVKAINSLQPQLAREVGRRLGFIKMRYLQIYGYDGLYQRVNNRSVADILMDFESSDDAPKTIAKGEEEGVRFELFDAPPNKPKDPE